MKSYEYDAFISHAVEDKIPIATELSQRLEAAGLKIWYSGRELNAGDSIATTIHDGLNKSRFGIVILSPSYVAKNWPLREFYHLLAREQNGVKVILPVLYNITPEDLALHDLTMADRFGIKAEKGLDHVISKLLEEIRRESVPAKTSKIKFSNLLIGLFALVALVASWLILSDKIGTEWPSDEFIKEAVQSRIDHFNQQTKIDKFDELAKEGAAPSSLVRLDSVFEAYQNLKSRYRNAYEFSNGFRIIRAKKNIDRSLAIDAAALNPKNSYGMKSCSTLLLSTKGNPVNYRYNVLNKTPVAYTLDSKDQLSDGSLRVVVGYKENLRLIEVMLVFNTDPVDVKRHQMNIYGFLPKEVYTFTKQGDSWSMVVTQQEIN